MSKFGDEFKAARAAGKKTFMFNGKSYTTRTADDNKRDAAAKDKPAAPASMDAATTKAVTKNTLEQAAIRGEQKPVELAEKVEPSRGRGARNTGVTGGAKLAPSPKEVAKGPSTEEKAAAAAARTKKAKADMEDTKARMSARREEKGGFKLFPKMASGGAVKAKGMGMARGSKACKVR